MYSLLVLLVTFLELAAVGAAYALESKPVFDALVIHGSPFYLAMNMLGPESVFQDKNPILIGLLLFHLLKYFMFFRAQLDDANKKRTLAIIFEAMYLALTTYYIY